MSDIVAIDRVRRVWDELPSYFDDFSATYKFESAKMMAKNKGWNCESVTASEFFKYLKEIKQERAMSNRNRRHAIDPNGDFDDMGNGDIERQYRYNQKRERGRL